MCVEWEWDRASVRGTRVFFATLMVNRRRVRLQRVVEASRASLAAIERAAG